MKKTYTSTKQGQLDFFCGIYSCVNMVGKVTDGKIKFSRRSIFSTLLDSLADDNALLRVHKHGTSTSQMIKYLRVIKKTFSNEYNVKLKFERAQIIDKDRHPKIIEIFQEQSSQPNTAVIFSFSGRLKHWSVISHITPKTVKLIDSWSYNILKLENIGKVHEIDDVFVVKAELPNE